MQIQPKMSRRAFLAAAGGTVIGVGLPGTFVKLLDAAQRTRAAEIRPDGRPRLPPGQLAVEKIRDMGGTRGTATIDNWRLRVHGEVENPVTLTYREFVDMESVNITCDVHCVTGWTLLDAQWTGVRLSAIMERIRPTGKGAFMIFEADGYTSNLPISDAGQENVILASHFFGEALSLAHGAPVRVVIPDRYFYKSVKWVTGIKITAHDEPGYWERSGYSNSADPWKEERFQKKN